MFYAHTHNKIYTNITWQYYLQPSAVLPLRVALVAWLAEYHRASIDSSFLSRPSGREICQMGAILPSRLGPFTASEAIKLRFQSIHSSIHLRRKQTFKYRE